MRTSITGRSRPVRRRPTGGELGRILWQERRHSLDLFAGVGFDGVVPFQDEDVMLSTVNANLGAGLPLFPGQQPELVLGVDVRREWMGERNEDHLQDVGKGLERARLRWDSPSTKAQPTPGAAGPLDTGCAHTPVW